MQYSVDLSSRASRWILALLAGALFFYAAYVLRFVLLPFVVAGGLAYVSMPAIDWLKGRFGGPRWVAAMAPLAVMLGMLTLIGLVVHHFVFPEVGKLLIHRQQILERFLNTVFQGKPIPTIGGMTVTAHDAAEEILRRVTAAVGSFDPIEAVGAAVTFAMGSIMTLVLYVYFLVDGPRIQRGMMWLVPPELRPRAEAIARRAGPMIFCYVRGMLIITSFATIFSWLALRFVLHVPNAIVLALAVGLLEMIPLIGPILSITVICVVAIEQLTLWNIIGMGVYVTALRVIIDQFIGPLILGKTMKLPPPAVIFAFIAGGAIWGFLGVAVAIPATAMVKIILEEAYGTSAKNAPKHPAEPAQS